MYMSSTSILVLFKYNAYTHGYIHIVFLYIYIYIYINNLYIIYLPRNAYETIN